MKEQLTFIIFINFLFFSTFSLAQQLIDIQEIAGINHTFQHETFIGGGAAFFDYDNDGDDDLYLTSGNRPDIFYENLGGGIFTEKTNEVGFFVARNYNTMGVIAGDIDNDGFKDLFVTTKQKLNGSFDKNLLFRNNGDGTFSDIWPADATNESTWSISATFLDYNLDGFLDIYVGNYVENSNLIRDEQDEVIGFGHTCFKNQLFKNRGDGRFSDVAEALQLADTGCALAVTASDYDNDGDLDLMVANDFGPDIEPNRFFRNDLDLGRFTEIGNEVNANQAIYGMGFAVGDYDNDLDLDYYVTNNGNNLLLQNDNGQFTDAAISSKTDHTWNTIQDSILSVSWGCAFLDLDNDTDLDLYVANGFVPGPDYLPTNIEDNDIVFLNNGDGTFQEDDQYFIDNTYVARGMAHSDIDNDGDLDVISVVQKAPLNATRTSKLFQNQLINVTQISNEGKNWLQLQLTGVTVNRDAYGSKVFLYADNQVFMRELNGAASHCSHSTSILHFGLKNIQQVDSLVIHWTGGMIQQTIYDIPVNRRILVTERETEFTTNTSEISATSALKLFPNPSKDWLYVELPAFENNRSVKISVLSVTGQSLFSTIIPASSPLTSTISIVDLPSGIYFLKVEMEGVVELRRFVKG